MANPTKMRMRCEGKWTRQLEFAPSAKHPRKKPTTPPFNGRGLEAAFILQNVEIVNANDRRKTAGKVAKGEQEQNQASSRRPGGRHAAVMIPSHGLAQSV